MMKLWTSRLVLGLALVALNALGLRAGDNDTAKRAPASIRGRIEIARSPRFRLPDLSRTVLYLASSPELDRETVETKGAEIGQRNKTFIPDLLVVPRGTTVEFPNWDPFDHNVFSRSRAASFNLDRYRHRQSRRYKFNEVGVVQVFCNIHPEMKAIIVVVPNRFYARADSQGRFQLTGVPTGQWELVAWHERCQEKRQAVELEPGQAVEVSITLRDARLRGSAD